MMFMIWCLLLPCVLLRVRIFKLRKGNWEVTQNTLKRNSLVYIEISHCLWLHLLSSLPVVFLQGHSFPVLELLAESSWRSVSQQAPFPLPSPVLFWWFGSLRRSPTWFSSLSLLGCKGFIFMFLWLPLKDFFFLKKERSSLGTGLVSWDAIYFFLCSY